jgi:putative tryptophan/tyrosine transport system substrate-binding protein
MMKRRAFVAGMAAAMAAPALGKAQPASERTYRVGILSGPTAEGKQYLKTFRAALRDLGYIERGNLALDVREPDGDTVRTPALVDELIALKPDVLVAWESTAQVIRSKTQSIPIVLTGAIDPVRAGLAQSLRRPGLNVTGIRQFNDELPGKHLEIMRAILPRLVRVGQFVDTTASGCLLVQEQAREASQRLGFEFRPYYVGNGDEIQRAFSQVAKDRPDVLLPCPSVMLFNQRKLLFENAMRLRIPFTSFVVASVPEGVLFAYSTNRHEEFRRAASYVDKILKGARPADLPIEQPTKFELVINLKTARAFNLTIPPSLLLRADQVIE